MLTTTIDIIRCGLKSDPTVTTGDRVRILALLRNGPSNTAEIPAVTSPRLLRPAKAAELLGCSTRMVHRLAAQGYLRKVVLPGRHRSAGVREQDVLALISAAPKEA